MISREQVEHIALLARVGLSPEEAERLQGQLSQILASFQALQEVDVEGVPPTGHSVALENVMREDEVASSLSQDDVMRNAPQREGEFLRVKAVLE